MEKLNRREALQKGGRMIMGAAACLSLAPYCSGCANEPQAIAAGRALRSKIRPADIEALKITIVYDNNPYASKLKIDWGFSCLVEGLDRTVLFDTGRFDTLLMANLAVLGVDPGRVDTVFLSHEHPDHVGGLATFLEHTTGVEVFMAPSFSSQVTNEAQSRGAAVREVGEPALVSGSGLSSGEMKSLVKNEHALFIDTTGGVVVITGCAHPGIVAMVERATKIMQKEVLLVLGGFHLLRDSAHGVQKVVRRLQEMNVRHVAPTHCSGGDARQRFAESYAENYLDCGVGRIITAKDLAGLRA